MLKVDLHIHTKEDKKDYVKYTAKEIIDRAAKLKFDVLSMAHHNSVFFNNSLKRHAQKRGILLIPGVEQDIEGAHILIINPPKRWRIKKLKDLEKIKNKNTLILASHPFYPIQSIGKRLERYNKFFDALEYCHFYFRFFNLFNKMAKKASKKYSLPMLGNSDAHNLWQFNSTFSYLDAKKDINSIFDAVRKNKIRIVTKPLPFYRFFEVFFFEFLKDFYRKLYKKI